MIGVIADNADQDVACEFFELFKTPWEFYQENRSYDVVLCAGNVEFSGDARLTVCYSSQPTHCDQEHEIQSGPDAKSPRDLLYQGNRIPIYGESIGFADAGNAFLTFTDSGEQAAYVRRADGKELVRIGYDLFREVRTLLTMGQPVANASIPTLELHIAMLRNLITENGVSLVEIPPVPSGHQFIACLTHDVDHPSIRPHKLDPTVVGFLWRAVFGSLLDVVRGWISLADAAKNWAAALKLPFVYLGLAKDFWSDFADRYLEVEKGLPSTFFVITRKNYAGRGVDTRAAALRAARYEAKELADTITRLIASDREVALHGIDAWLDSSAGREELEEVRRLTGVSEVGVRMHWLYYNENSPTTLEKAGASYDSTSGYNEAVGYRAGTTQAFKPLGAERMLELPLHAMDTALFYLSYLALSPKEASSRLSRIANDAVQYGGCVTVNWHDRSLAPERLWGNCYRQLIENLKRQGAWFATASQAASWFRKRRSARFEMDKGGRRTRVKIRFAAGENLPGLQLREHKPEDVTAMGPRRSNYTDVAVEESIAATAFQGRLSSLSAS